MSMTVQQIIDNVKDHLGNRASGYIGSRATETVILDTINLCLLKISKCKKHIPAFEKVVTIAVSSGNYQYALPVMDSTGSQIKIKKFLRFVIAKPGETTGYNVSRITAFHRDRVFPLTNTSHTGRPAYYSIYGSLMELYPFPDDIYTMTGRAIVYPSRVLATGVDSGIGMEFDDVIEEFATGECFARLQQPEDSNSWLSRYKQNLKETLASLDDYPDEEQFLEGEGTLVGQMEITGPTSSKSRFYNSALGIS